MASESSFVSLEVAQSLFESLPPEMQWPTLSPAYVAADVMRDDQSTPVFLVSREGAGFLMHAVHETRVPGLDVSDWQSAYGYGGPIAHHLGGAALTRAWAKLDATAMERKIVAEFVRFHPSAENHRFYTGSVRDDRSVVVIDLTIPDLLASYSGRARTAIRKAERNGLQVVCESTDCALDLFPDFYRHCMHEIGAENFYLFSDRYFDGLLHLPGARVLSVFKGDERLSMGLFLFGTKRAEYHLSGTLQSARQSGSTNLLIHAAAKLAQSAGCLTLYLGGGTSAQPDDPLLRFKESFAAPSLTFRIGHRIFDSVAYADLRRSFPELAAKSKRILFTESEFMSWDPVWEQIFTSQAWGRYPGEDVIRFAARNFYSVPDRSSVKFLEVGFGTGTNLWYLAREGFSANGIEGSKAAAAIARERLDNDCPGWSLSPRNGRLLIGDMMKLEWPDGEFDALIDSEAVYCNDFDESCRIYQEMHRVAKPGGKLFVRTFATGCWGDGIGTVVGARRYIADAGPMAGKGPSRFTDEDQLAELLGPWKINEINLITRSLQSQQHCIREWIVEAEKN